MTAQPGAGAFHAFEPSAGCGILLDRGIRRLVTAPVRNRPAEIAKETAPVEQSGEGIFLRQDSSRPFAVKMNGGRALTPPSELRIVPQWQKSGGTLIVTAALELSSNRVTHFYSTKKNTSETASRIFQRLTTAKILTIADRGLPRERRCAAGVLPPKSLLARSRPSLAGVRA